MSALWLVIKTFFGGPFLTALGIVWGWLCKIVSVPAWCLVLILVIGYGWHVHHQGAAVDAAVAANEVKWQKAAKDAEVLAKADYAKELRAASVIGAKVVSALMDAATAREKVQVVTRTIVQEVSHAVDQSPDLARVVVPADVVRLRHDQVSQSAAAAAAGYPP